MIFAMDVGNTNTVLGIFEDQKLIKNWRISTDQHKTPDEYGILFFNLFSHAGLRIEDIKGIVISSVVPPVVMVLKETTQSFFGIEPLVVGPGIKTGMNIKMDNPREVGADRIVNAVRSEEHTSELQSRPHLVCRLLLEKKKKKKK